MGETTERGEAPRASFFLRWNMMLLKGDFKGVWERQIEKEKESKRRRELLREGVGSLYGGIYCFPEEGSSRVRRREGGGVRPSI